uniref:Uncharacterized protein n=1 Tax=Oryza rufipogon TaxID=4529 RepID=A0A0E0N653_ORYRU
MRRAGAVAEPRRGGVALSRYAGQVGNDESSQNPIPFQPSSPRRRAAPSSTAAGEGAADEAGWSRSRGLHSIVSQSLPERAPRSRSRRCGGPALAMVFKSVHLGGDEVNTSFT